jgi:hypothetical protein
LGGGFAGLISIWDGVDGRMRIYLGGHLDFYNKQEGSWLEVHLSQPVPLREVLEQQGIPAGEVHLVVRDGEQMELDNLMVSDHDEVKLFSAVGGGSHGA